MNDTLTVVKPNGDARTVVENPPVIDWRDAGQSDHFVQFYKDDSFLVSAVTRFIAEGFRGNERTLIIATPSHIGAVNAALGAEGFDVAALEAAGQYTTLDAANTLSMFMVDGMPDSRLFNEVIGANVAVATAGGRSLRAFGEMVALLWADGNTSAATRLEELWNELCQRHVFNLFCAYPMTGFSNPSCNTPFLHVCNSHTRVLPAETYGAGSRTADDRLKEIAILQQKAETLEVEIAERKRVEADLRRSKDELAAFIETASLGLHWVGPDGTILWANTTELAMLGYTREEYVGRNISEFHTDQLVIDDILGRLCRGEKLRNYEARLRCKSGAVKIVLIDSSVLWENGRFVHTQCFTHDITEQREAEVSNRRLAAIVESSDDAIISKSLKGIITSWNQGAERIFGYTAAEAIGRSIIMLIPPARHGEEAEIISRVARGERIEHYETVRQRKDGSCLEISLTVSPVKDALGRIVGISKIARDITPRKRTEQALQTARESLAKANEYLEHRVQERTHELAEAVAQMEEFSYTVSHDIRAPLRGMQVYSQALLEDYGPNLEREARHCLERIAENATRLDRMVLDVLTFSRVSRSEIQLERVSLDKLVRHLVQHYPDMQPPRALLSIEPLEDVIGHEPSLTQALSNLLTNAVKFVAPGVMPKVRIWTELRDGNVRLSIADNGIGIKPCHQNRLFRMFERIHPTLPYEGTGVGLAIVRKALNRMGGDTGMESDGVSGSRFWIELPRALATS
jgi:PAS domain S-box-containing protein